MGKILVVDDEKSVRFAFGLLLKKVGHTVVEAANEVDAKDLLDSNQFDVALVDRLLGSYNGLDIIKYINQTQASCTPILISGFPTFKSASEAIKLNVLEYLVKPVKKNELYEAVNAALTKNKEGQNLKMKGVTNV